MPNIDKWVVGILFGAIVTYEAMSLFIGIAPHEIMALRRRVRRAPVQKPSGGVR